MFNCNHNYIQNPIASILNILVIMMIIVQSYGSKYFYLKIVCLVFFYGIYTIVGYLMPNPF